MGPANHQTITGVAPGSTENAPWLGAASVIGVAATGVRGARAPVSKASGTYTSVAAAVIRRPARNASEEPPAQVE